jgi:hypothetical protein
VAAGAAAEAAFRLNMGRRRPPPRSADKVPDMRMPSRPL